MLKRNANDEMNRFARLLWQSSLKRAKKTGRVVLTIIYILLMQAYKTYKCVRLKEMLRERLIQCGWRDDLKEYCQDVIRRKGLEKVTIEELVLQCDVSFTLMCVGVRNNTQRTRFELTIHIHINKNL